jgi:glycyl-tRNA synthetase
LASDFALAARFSLDLMDKLVSLCKRRGFIFQSSEIYGGTGSVWDYGPLGVELQRNVKEAWWRSMVHERDDIEGLDAAILMHPRVWEASGHVSGFTDPLVDCRTCKARFRADQMESAQCPRKPSRRPGEHDDCSLTEPRLFNLMFKTFMGPVEEAAAVVYLRPETAQGSYVNFQNVLTRARGSGCPSALRRSARRSATRSRRATSSSGPASSSRWRCSSSSSPAPTTSGSSTGRRSGWSGLRSLGVNARSCASSSTGRTSWRTTRRRRSTSSTSSRSAGRSSRAIHNRTDFDLRRHQEYSGKKLEYVDPVDRDKRYLPYVIETAVGVGRTVLVAGRRVPRGRGGGRAARGAAPAPAPGAAEGGGAAAGEEGWHARDGGADASRPAAERHPIVLTTTAAPSAGATAGMDEAGTPFAITVDGQSVSDRHRDGAAS